MKKKLIALQIAEEEAEEAEDGDEVDNDYDNIFYSLIKFDIYFSIKLSSLTRTERPEFVLKQEWKDITEEVINDFKEALDKFKPVTAIFVEAKSDDTKTAPNQSAPPAGGKKKKKIINFLIY